ncbi:hypothetical protein D9M68_752730 [compost metagenome]
MHRGVATRFEFFGKEVPAQLCVDSANGVVRRVDGRPVDVQIDLVAGGADDSGEILAATFVGQHHWLVPDSAQAFHQTRQGIKGFVEHGLHISLCLDGVIQKLLLGLGPPVLVLRQSDKANPVAHVVVLHVSLFCSCGEAGAFLGSGKTTNADGRDLVVEQQAQIFFSEFVLLGTGPCGHG